MNAYLYLLIGFIGGLVISSLAGFYFYRRLNYKWDKVLATLYISDAYIALKHLRSDKTALVIKSREMWLDCGIIGLGRQLRAVAPHRRNEDDLRWLRRAKEYRTKYPYSSGIPDVDSTVKEGLALVD